MLDCSLRGDPERASVSDMQQARGRWCKTSTISSGGVHVRILGLAGVSRTHLQTTFQLCFNAYTVFHRARWLVEKIALTVGTPMLRELAPTLPYNSRLLS